MHHFEHGVLTYIQQQYPEKSISCVIVVFCLVGMTDDDEMEEGAGAFGFSLEAASADNGDTYPCTYCGIAFVTHHELKASISYIYPHNFEGNKCNEYEDFFQGEKTCKNGLNYHDFWL